VICNRLAFSNGNPEGRTTGGTPEEFKAMAHPLRLRILRLCLQRRDDEQGARRPAPPGPRDVLHHVRLLVRTGFLVPDLVRTGARRSRESPTAPRKSWVLSVETPEQGKVEQAAVLDALEGRAPRTRARRRPRRCAHGCPTQSGEGEALSGRIEKLIQDLANEPDEPDGEKFGFYVTWHRR